jgi:soluble lytic murein transglycosylase-like protein
VLLRSPRGQASLLVVAGLAGLLVTALIIGAVARAVGTEGGAQRAADLAAVAAGNAMHENYGRLFVPALIRDQPNPEHLEKPEYLALGRERAVQVARANGAEDVTVAFPDQDTIAPVRVRVQVHETVKVGGHSQPVVVSAEAALGPADLTGFAMDGGYEGPLAYRQGKPMRPDVALAFDRLDAAARADGIALTITSGYRSDAEQAVLFAQHPDPKWVARPGTSLHRYGTELDLGPPSAYGWLAANAGRFHFTQRYSWEPWHYGFVLNAQSHVPKVKASGDGSAGAAHGSVPGFVPAQYAPILARAAQRWNVSATLLAAQLYAESTFNPFAHSRAGALGIAQFMPGTAAAMGLDDPFDPDQAIDAQAHLMRDLLRQFGSVPLALAAYNAGPGAVAACGCVPNIPETQGYVTRILGLMAGAGVPLTPGDGSTLAVRLVK